MNQMHVPGSHEILTEAERLVKLVMARATVEQRLDGIAPADRLRGLSPAELDQLRALLLKSDKT